MARKFFNQKVKGSSNKSLVAYIIVGVCILLVFVCIIMIVLFSNRKPDNATIEIRDVVTVEINSEIPDKTLFFSELQNVKEDEIDVSFAEADLTKVGEYPIEIKLRGETYESKLAVVDTQAPNLMAKNYSIAVGGTYEANDFVESCSDNSGEDCIIEFYTLGMDQEGTTIDYGSYTEEGTYTVQIIAKDSSGNATTATSARLTIGESGEIQIPTSCNYGNSEYDSSQYILGVNVTQNGCALDLNLYQDEKVTAPAYALADADTERLQKEISKLNINENLKRNLYRLVTPVLNTAGTGIVGYTVHMELAIEYEDGHEEVVASYYINTEGKRIYSVNTYNLAQ